MRLSGATSNGHGAAGTSTLACERSSSSQSEASRRPDLGAQRPANLPHGAVRGGVGRCLSMPWQLAPSPTWSTISSVPSTFVFCNQFPWYRMTSTQVMVTCSRQLHAPSHTQWACWRTCKLLDRAVMLPLLCRDFHGVALACSRLVARTAPPAVQSAPSVERSGMLHMLIPLLSCSASTAVRPRGMSQAQWELHQDEMALQEAIQLSLAMEESRRELEAASAAYAGAAPSLLRRILMRSSLCKVTAAVDLKARSIVD